MFTALKTFYIAKTKARLTGVGEGIHNPVTRIFVILRDTIRTDGAVGLCKQVFPSIVLNSITGFLTFTIYGELIRHWQKLNWGHNTVSETIPFRSAFLAGAIGGACQFIISAPLDTIKFNISTEIERTHHHKGIFHVSKQIYAQSQQGLQGFYLGGSLSLFREMFGMALFFSTYETSKHYLKTQFSSSPYGDVYAVAVAGGFAGSAYQLVNHPTELVKSQVYASHLLQNLQGRHTVLNACKSIYLSEGIRGFFPGLIYSLLKSFSPSAVGFLAYEIVLHRQSHL
eukprot:Sdes_comp18490_c0_seq1m8491